METIRGKAPLDLDFNGLTERLTNYNRVILDLGTGDGRYVHYLADNFPNYFIIGVDSCRENLREHLRTKLTNAFFVIASAQDFPQELNGLISHIAINFPWGGLLDSLLDGDTRLLGGLESISRLSTSVDILLNGGALAEAGWSLENGAERIYSNLLQAGWQINVPAMMNANALQNFPSTWAKRLAFGRDPRAILLSGYFE